MERSLLAAVKRIETWEALATFCEGQMPEIKKSLTVYARRSLALGWSILQFSQRPEINAEIQKANSGRRGAKWEPHNYVAVKLCGQTVAQVPSVKYLSSCARLARDLEAAGKLEAALNGETDETMRELLGWTGDNSDARALPMVIPQRKSEAAPEEVEGPAAPDEFAEMFIGTFAKMSDHVKKLAAKRPRGVIRMSDEQREQLLQHRIEINRFLQYVNMAIHEVQRGR